MTSPDNNAVNDAPLTKNLDRPGNRLSLTVRTRGLGAHLTDTEEELLVALARTMTAGLPAHLEWFFTLSDGPTQLLHESSEEDDS